MLSFKARSVDREKTAHVNRLTLNFHESEKEKSYHQDFDFGFTAAMGTSLLLLILSAGLQVRWNLIFQTSRTSQQLFPNRYQPCPGL